MMVRSGGFKMPEELLRKKEGMRSKEEDKEATEKEFAERRQQILNDLNISYEALLREAHSSHV